MAAAAVDTYLVGRWPVMAAAPAIEQIDPQGPLDTLPVGTLTARADDPDPLVRQQAVDELGRRGAIAELAELLGHGRPDVRQRVPFSLMLASQAAHDQIPLLAACLESPDEATRQAAAEALLVVVRARGPYHGQRDQARLPAPAAR